ncbi:MAG: toll/interleukin-1 receptor domain-containing protein [Cyanothece sp. SIO1E1]|nr:toll/interleukin-1 receptor domain-containing protein [Cyanothece sp. SIO1E1]
MKDFFISYNRFDKQWAEWIAWTLEEAGYSVVIQAWDFRPGGNFILDMQRAAAETTRTIAVFSETYLKSAYTQPEWAAAFAQDPSALERKLIPVRVKECKPEGMLKPIVYVDLVGASKVEAKQKLLEMLRDRLKPTQEPDFPGDAHSPQESLKETPHRPVSFPSEATRPAATSRVTNIKIRNLKQQMQALEEEYNAAFEQLQFTDNAVSRKRLERQIQLIEQKLTAVAEQLDELGK